MLCNISICKVFDISIHRLMRERETDRQTDRECERDGEREREFNFC